MICNNCGREVNDGISFCPYCSAYVNNSPFQMFNNNQDSHDNNMSDNNKLFQINKKVNKNKKDFNPKKIFYLVMLILWGIAVYFIVNAFKPDYYFEGDTNPTSGSYQDVSSPENDVNDQPSVSEEPGVENPTPSSTPSNNNNDSSNNKKKNNTNNKKNNSSKNNASKSNTGVTSIKYDNKYEGKTLNSANDVYNFIKSDSENQKANCPSNVVAIENSIISNYGIKAVNFCEMDVSLASDLSSVVGYIYNYYPGARGNLTNLTIANIGENESFMAAFMPMFTFVTSNTNNKYPIGVKTEIVLNAKYFLNTSKLDSSVKYGVDTNYFPPNATKSSTVAHEFGHYLSYVALLNHYGASSFVFTKASNVKMLYAVYDDYDVGNFSYEVVKEAYDNYSGNLNFDQFRASISKYAIAKDANGNYIYDETIAEAFHDCYLNGNSAQIASRLIMQSLKKYL